MFHNSLQLWQELGGAIGAVRNTPPLQRSTYTMLDLNAGILKSVIQIEECGQFSLIVGKCVGGVLRNPCQDAAGGKQIPLEMQLLLICNPGGGQEKKNVANVY